MPKHKDKIFTVYTENELNVMRLRQCAYCSSIASHLHGSQLEPCPGGVQLGGPDEGEVDAE